MRGRTFARCRDLPAPRILLVMMSAVGDAVHALPVVTALKRHDPGALITWVLQPGPASLVRGHPDVDEIVLFERGAGWRAYPRVRRALAGRRFDLVLDTISADHDLVPLLGMLGLDGTLCVLGTTP